MIRSLVICAALGLSATALWAQPRTGPALDASSNLSQGNVPNLIPQARALGVTHLRDGMNWSRVETVPGRYRFDDPRTRFPDIAAKEGMDLSLIINWGNPLYDGGATPQSDTALAALSAYTRALITRFPAVTGIEVGNEINGVNFVRGPMKAMKPLERARAYVPMLRTTAQAARDVRPDIRVLGGATHSLAGAFLWEIMDAGGAAYMDALALHPYTTKAEHFVRQMAVLRRHPDLASMPVEITEFGTPGPNRSPDHLMRNYCQFALGGVTRAVWFPANLRGEKMTPLFTPQGRITPAGRAFRLVQTRMAGRAVQDVARDPFSYGCQFGDDVQVLWGMPRDVTVTPGVRILNGQAQPVDGPVRLSETAPLIFVAEGPIADQVTLGPISVVADSFHQFAYPDAGEALAPGDGFARFALSDGQDIPLNTLPGQEASGTPWFPYRGNPDLRPLRLTPDSLVPGLRRQQAVEIVHRYTAPQTQTLRLTARFAPAKRSSDGVTVRVMVNDTPRFDAIATPGKPLDVALDTLSLAKGDRLDVMVGPNGAAKGDVTRYRITLHDAP